MLQTTKDILADLIAFPTVSANSNLDMIAYLASRLEDCGADVLQFTDPSVASSCRVTAMLCLRPTKTGQVIRSR